MTIERFFSGALILGFFLNVWHLLTHALSSNAAFAHIGFQLVFCVTIFTLYRVCIKYRSAYATHAPDGYPYGR